MSKLNLTFNPASSVPKYLQLIDSIIQSIDTNQISIGQQLPSINELCKQLAVSRDTVLQAYRELQERGIISARHGKGFYVSSLKTQSILKVFVLFDAMNQYKETLYRSLIQSLGKGFDIDIAFHYYNAKTFDQLISNNLTEYGYYVVMPHFNTSVLPSLAKIPSDKLLILDAFANTDSSIASVYQNFEDDIYRSLEQALSRIRNYQKLHFVYSDRFQFIPTGMLTGYERFCRQFSIQSNTLRQFNKEMVEPGNCYIVVSDNDLIELIKGTEARKLKPGKDIGIISYDDTPLKEVLKGGITTISTDFVQMGKTAAELIKSRRIEQIHNPASIIFRKSL